MRSIAVVFVVLLSSVFINPSQVYEPFTEPLAEMPGVEKVNDRTARYALKRINQYRIAAGLDPWSYDARLSRMAQAHADYMVLSCLGGRKWTGHFENPSYPGYTKQGDEAAQTSGISGGPDILYAYEALMKAVFHRSQFLKVGKKRVGYGFKISNNQRCSGGLFVTRPRYIRWDYGEPRFILFPPPGFTDSLSSFFHEWPDPIPVKNHGTTGYIISIQMHRRDVANYRGCNVRVSDQSGGIVRCWVTDPQNPSVKSINTSTKYKPGKKVPSNVFAKNFDMIFIMPKKPLKPGMKYMVNAALNFSNGMEKLKWWFRVRPNRKWNLVQGSTRPEEQLDFILVHAMPGDLVTLPGFEVKLEKPSLWIKKNIIIRGNGNSIIRNQPTQRSMISVYQNSTLKFENVTFQSHNQMFYIKSGSSIVFRGCRFNHLRKNKFFLSLEGESSVIFENCDFSDFQGPWFVYTSSSQSQVMFSGNTKGPVNLLKKYSRGKGSFIKK